MRTHPLVLAVIAVVLHLPALQAQNAADLAKGARAAAEADDSVNYLEQRLRNTLNDTRDTIAVLEASLRTLRGVRLKQAATDIGALIKALKHTEEHLVEQLQTLDRLRKAGAPSESDPLQDVLRQLGEAMPKSTSKDRLDKQLTTLRETLECVEATPQLKPFAGLVHYHIGDTQFQKAVALIRKKQQGSAKRFYEQAIKNFEQAADDKREDVGNAGVGSSLRATAIYRAVVIHAALYQSNGVSRSSKRKHKESANRWFEILKRDHTAATLDNQRRAVDAAYREAQNMR